jgi:hypothetical protein
MYKVNTVLRRLILYKAEAKLLSIFITQGIYNKYSLKRKQ